MSQFLRRRCHRDESAIACQRFARKHDGTAATGKRRRHQKRKTHQEIQLEKDKWGVDENDEVQPPAQPAADDGFFDGYQLLNDDAEEEELERMLLSQASTSDAADQEGQCGEVDFQFTEEEILRLISNAANGEERVRVVRELGASTTVRVTKECSNMCCNCESYTRWRICRHVAWFRVLHYEKYPSGVVSDSEDGWNGIKDKLREILRKTHIVV